MIYLDVKWANAQDSVVKMWAEDDLKGIGGTKKAYKNVWHKKGRLILLHAGGENGWIDGVALVCQSKKASKDYMTSEYFEEWLL